LLHYRFGFNLRAGSMNTLICDEECSFLSVSNDFLHYAGDRLYRMRTDGSDKVALTEDLTIFPCVAGDWVYRTGRCFRRRFVLFNAPGLP
jgi:hypothetical protein